MKLLIALMFSLWAAVANAQGTIVLVVDISSSMEAKDLDLQFTSYARAMRELPYLENVNIEVVLFSESPELISSGSRHDAAIAFDNAVRSAPEYRGSTCLSRALNFVETMFPSVPQPIVIDISGDGEANCEGDNEIHDLLDRLASKGARVNTLLIDSEKTYDVPTSPQGFYQSITRDGFMINAPNFYAFETAIFEKLTLEVAQLN